MPPIKSVPHILPFFLSALLVCFCAGIGHSAEGGAPAQAVDMPEFTIAAATETHAPVRLRPGKPQIIRLDARIGSVAVEGMSERVTAVGYDEKSVALVPRNIGVSHLTVFDKDGAPLMARYVVVAEAPTKYIRIRQTCKKAGVANCEKIQVYYCPNLCYETRIVGAYPATTK